MYVSIQYIRPADVYIPTFIYIVPQFFFYRLCIFGHYGKTGLSLYLYIIIIIYDIAGRNIHRNRPLYLITLYGRLCKQRSTTVESDSPMFPRVGFAPNSRNVTPGQRHTPPTRQPPTRGPYTRLFILYLCVDSLVCAHNTRT